MARLRRFVAAACAAATSDHDGTPRKARGWIVVRAFARDGNVSESRLLIEFVVLRRS